jgi:hypothetical protein
MATIYDKGVSGDKCLVLNPREALFYDFNFGTGWKEVRIGMAYSFVNSTGNNELRTTETVVNTTFNHTNNIYVGLTNSTNNSIPYANTGIFIGMSSFTGSNVTLNAANIASNSRYGVINNQSFSGSFSNYNSVYLSFSSATNATGNSSYLSYYALRINIEPLVKSFSVRGANVSVDGNNPSISFLRSQINNFAGAIPSADSTGFYTTAFNATGDLLPYPDKVLIYFPFFNNKIRIHNLLVEKYN